MLRAPIAGRVTALTARVGQPPSPQSQLMAIAPIGAKLRAELAVPSAAISFVKPGQEVRLTIDAFPLSTLRDCHRHHSDRRQGQRCNEGNLWWSDTGGTRFLHVPQVDECWSEAQDDRDDRAG